MSKINISYSSLKIKGEEFVPLEDVQRIISQLSEHADNMKREGAVEALTAVANCLEEGLAGVKHPDVGVVICTERYISVIRKFALNVAADKAEVPNGDNQSNG